MSEYEDWCSVYCHLILSIVKPEPKDFGWRRLALLRCTRSVDRGDMSMDGIRLALY